MRYLVRHGFRLIERNFSCKAGEIDLIGQFPDGQLVFVEVRYRNTDGYGSALATVTPTKQLRIQRAAAWYLQKNRNLQEMPSRFDVVAIQHHRHCREEILWVRNAFGQL